MNSTSRAATGNPNKPSSYTTESWDSHHPSFPNPGAAPLQDAAKAVHQLLCLQKLQLPTPYTLHPFSERTLQLGPCPKALSKQPTALGEPTALPPGLMPLATTDTLGCAGCASTQLRAAARSSPVVAAGWAWLAAAASHHGWHRAGLK